MSKHTCNHIVAVEIVPSNIPSPYVQTRCLVCGETWDKTEMELILNLYFDDKHMKDTGPTIDHPDQGG